MKLNELSEKVIGAAYEVGTVAGTGFAESVYENAMLVELGLRGLKAESQSHIPVRYKGHMVGDFRADLLVEDRLLVELKAAAKVGAEAHAQCINYLRATGLKLCLLINFGAPRVDVKRIVLGFDEEVD